MIMIEIAQFESTTYTEKKMTALNLWIDLFIYLRNLKFFFTNTNSKIFDRFCRYLFEIFISKKMLNLYVDCYRIFNSNAGLFINVQ